MSRELLLAKVRSRLMIPTRRPTEQMDDGAHGSIHRGRSMDFDDLREYVVGDDVRDIDWKATARAGRPLIKRYVATRRHAVLLTVDTGATMAGLAAATTPKRDVAVLAAGVIGQIAMQHGDSVGLVAGPIAQSPDGPGALVRNRERIVYLPPLRGDVHLERVLRTIHDAIDVDGEPSRLDDVLSFVARRFQRRMVVVVIADDIGLDEARLKQLRRLAVRQEVLHCTVGDVAMTEPALAESTLRAVGTPLTVPPYFRADAELHVDLGELARQRERDDRALLAAIGIATVRLADEAAAVGTVIQLVQRQRLFGVGRRR